MSNSNAMTGTQLFIVLTWLITAVLVFALYAVYKNYKAKR